MNVLSVLDLLVVLLFALMAFRAFRSGSPLDILLGLAQCAGLVLLFIPYRDSGMYLLLITAGLYLASQLLTGARPLSRLLPIAGAAAVVAALFWRA